MPSPPATRRVVGPESENRPKTKMDTDGMINIRAIFVDTCLWEATFEDICSSCSSPRNDLFVSPGTGGAERFRRALAQCFAGMCGPLVCLVVCGVARVAGPRTDPIVPDSCNVGAEPPLGSCGVRGASRPHGPRIFCAYKRYHCDPVRVSLTHGAIVRSVVLLHCNRSCFSFFRTKNGARLCNSYRGYYCTAYRPRNSSFFRLGLARLPPFPAAPLAQGCAGLERAEQALRTPL